MNTTTHFIDPEMNYLERSHHKIHPNIKREQLRNAIIEWANKFNHKLVNNIHDISENTEYYEFDLKSPIYLQTFILSDKKKAGQKTNIEYWGNDNIRLSRYLYLVTDKDLDPNIFFNDTYSIKNQI